MVARLGRYDVLDELGKGGMGVVYKARDPLLGRLVVIKTISPTLTGDQSFRTRFYREARAAALLHHPNIVTVYELGEDHGCPFIAMEFLPGMSLAAVISARLEMVLPKKLAVISQVGEALAFAHKNGIVHRDVKPANIMLLPHGTVKVVDFGIARMPAEGTTQTGQLVGTLDYMSPEQVQGERADARSDIFSLGVVLYELLAFRRPFTGANAATLLMRLVNNAPTPIYELVPQCPDDLAGVIERALEKKRTRRFQNMEEFVGALRPIYLRTASHVADRMFEDARRFVESRQWPSAKSCLEQMLAIDATRRDAVELLDRVGREIRRDALHLQLAPRVRMARQMLVQKQYAEAEGECASILGEDESHLEAQQLLAVAQRALEAQARVERELVRARDLCGSGSLSEAELTLIKILAVDPDCAEANELIGSVREQMQERAVRRRLNDGLMRAESLLGEGRFADAQRTCEELTREFPREPDVKRLQGEIWARVQSAKVDVKLGNARELFQQKKYAECIRECRGALDIEPSRDDAKKLLREARRLEDVHRHTLSGVNVVRELVRQESLGRAAHEISRLLELDPTNTDVQRLVEEVKRRGAEFPSGQRKPSEDGLPQTAVAPSNLGRVPAEHLTGIVSETPPRGMLPADSCSAGRSPSDPILPHLLRDGASGSMGRAAPPFAGTLKLVKTGSLARHLARWMSLIVLVGLFAFGGYRAYVQWNKGDVLAPAVLSTSPLPVPRTGDILGKVVDAQGTALGAVIVSLRNLRTGKTESFLTDVDGSYAFHHLEPGVYTVTLDYAGWRDHRRAGRLNLALGAVRRADLVVGEGTARIVPPDRGSSSRSASLPLKSTVNRASAPLHKLEPTAEAPPLDVEIDGRLNDGYGKPLVGIRLRLVTPSGASAGEVVTGPGGHFKFVGVVPGNYSILCLPPSSYLSKTIPTGSLQGGNLYEFDFSLDKAN